MRQLDVQRPRLILTLGVVAPCVLAPQSPELEAWSMARGLKHLDTAGPVQHRVSFPQLQGLRSTVVALTHPCLRHASLRHRSYQGLTGAAAELRMLEEAVRG